MALGVVQRQPGRPQRVGLGLRQRGNVEIVEDAAGVAVDPRTGSVYETEDRQTAGFYRFAPTEREHLAAGGHLEMLAITHAPQADMRTKQRAGVWHPVTWVPIDEPDPAEITDDAVFAQGFATGGALFARLEGAWYGDSRIYFVSTSGGDAQLGQVWEYNPAAEQLRLLFESPGSDVLDMPDNICVSPRGGLVLCEDGDQRWTPKFGQVVKVGSRPKRRSLECHGRDGVIRLS